MVECDSANSNAGTELVPRLFVQHSAKLRGFIVVPAPNPPAFYKADAFCCDDDANQAAFFSGRGRELIVKLQWD